MLKILLLLVEHSFFFIKNTLIYLSLTQVVEIFSHVHLE